MCPRVNPPNLGLWLPGGGRITSQLGPYSTRPLYWTLAVVPKPAHVVFLLTLLASGFFSGVALMSVSFCSPEWFFNPLLSFNHIWQQAWGLKKSCMFCKNKSLIRWDISFYLVKDLSVCLSDRGEHTWESSARSLPSNTATRRATWDWNPKNSLFHQIRSPLELLVSFPFLDFFYFILFFNI